MTWALNYYQSGIKKQSIQSNVLKKTIRKISFGVVQNGVIFALFDTALSFRQ